MNQPQLELLNAYNEKNKIMEYISTGATFNNIHYISTPVIIGKYDTSDVTLRKKYKKEGKYMKDYFFSDGRVFVSEIFLKKQNINLIPTNKTVRNSITKEHHTGPKFPYTKFDNSQETKMEQLMLNNPALYNGKLIINELKKMHWDEFITISTGKFMDQNSWDQAMLNFTDLLALQTKSLKIRIAYSTEVSIDIRHKRVTKYENNHRHIHLFLDYGGSSIIPKVQKPVKLTTPDRFKLTT